MRSIYLASPLGFAASTRGFMEELIGELTAVVRVVNPWDEGGFEADFVRVNAMTEIGARREGFHAVNMAIGGKNEELIRSVDMLVGVLDGVDVDSGTAAEMGFAYGLGLRVFGLRTDWRVTGDNEAAGVNLQLRYFIERSGGSYHTTVEGLMGALRAAGEEGKR